MSASGLVGHPSSSTNSNRQSRQIFEASVDFEKKASGRTRADSSNIHFSTGKDLITYIFPDFKAVEYVRKDFISLNEFHIMETTEATGFEIYLVDQWIRDRKISSVASVYTGNLQSKVRVCKFTTTKRQSREYPPRFQEYMNELLLNHATFKRLESTSANDVYTHTGADDGFDIPAYLLVTNISAMPHNLFLIPIPEGDARAVEHRYMINTNLKKLNCGGRSLSLLTERVSDASEDKFRQMYCILNETIPISFAILELVNLVQTCLFYFDLLDAKYADGLLCHKTEDAIKNWWNLVGLPHFNSKPSHRAGILSSHTVAAVLSLTVSVKLRLQMIGGCDVPKDLFDAENFMISIGHFQKQIKIEKRRKLNLLTLSRLFHYTHQNGSSEKSKPYQSTFGAEQSFDDSESTSFYDQAFNSPAGLKNKSVYSSTSLPGQTASAYRRNKIYYSKELKKLTNVVKNTVQDHIMVKEDQDDVYADNTNDKPSTKLRSKLASKFSDNLVPSDIETTDIEAFAKKCVVGKTLHRLWNGLSSVDIKSNIDQVEDEKVLLGTSPRYQNENSKAPRRSSGANIAQHKHQLYREGKEPYASTVPSDSDGYTFLSFRDSLFADQEFNHSAERSGRLGKMKLSFQNRKYPTKADTSDQTERFSKRLSRDENFGSLLDDEMQKLAERSPSLNANVDLHLDSSIMESKKGPTTSLSRRSSFPFVKSAGESNLRIIDDLLSKGFETKAQKPPLQKAASFSLFENYYSDIFSPLSHERLRQDYLEQVSNLMWLEDVRKDKEFDLEHRVFEKEKHANIEIQRIWGSHSSIVHRKSRFEREYSAVLDIRMRDLADNLDKMAFRSRDLLKKIDELDEHLSIFKAKLNTESKVKLDVMVDRVLHSPKFNCVLESREQKLEIWMALTGSEMLHDQSDLGGNTGLGAKLFVLFFYDFFLAVLRLFHFDRSKMNLDRIRNQYQKLDPNRKFISKIYGVLGFESKKKFPNLCNEGNKVESTVNQAI